MLPKNNRLTSRETFADLKKSGRKDQSNSFALLYKENNQTSCRFGIIVSNRISKKATERNLVKRRLREIFFKLLPCLSGNFDFLFLTKTDIINKNMSEMEKEVFDLFKRLGLSK